MRLEGLRLELPVGMASQADGSLLVLYQDGLARTLWPDGRSLDEVLPSFENPVWLAAPPSWQPDMYMLLWHSPHYRFDAHVDMLMDDPWPAFLPWHHADDEDGYRTVLPRLLAMIVWFNSWDPYISRYYKRPPPDTPRRTHLLSCTGGGALLDMGGQLAVRTHRGDPWTWFTPVAETSGTEDPVGACHRIADAFHVASAKRELRLLAGGRHEELAPDARVLAHYPETAPDLQKSLGQFGVQRELDGCRASDGERSRIFAWTEHNQKVQILALDQGGPRSVATYPAGARMQCQHGGLGLFVATTRGVELLSTDAPGPKAVRAVAPQLSPPDNLPPARPSLSHRNNMGLRLNRVQVRFRYKYHDSEGFRAMGNGPVRFDFRDSIVARSNWLIEAVFQWHFGDAGAPYSSESGQRHLLSSVPPALAVSEFVGQPRAVYPSQLYRYETEAVFEALNRNLFVDMPAALTFLRSLGQSITRAPPGSRQP